MGRLRMRLLVMLIGVTLAMAVLPAGAASAEYDGGYGYYGSCAILVWFDSADVIADTEAGLDEWKVEGVLRTASPMETNGAIKKVPMLRRYDPSAIGTVAFEGNAGDSVTLEREWSTELWQSFGGFYTLERQVFHEFVPLHDLAITVREKDGRAGDDMGSAAIPFDTVLDCGSTVSFSVPVLIEPLGLRGMPSPTETPGLIEFGITITTVPVFGFAT